MKKPSENSDLKKKFANFTYPVSDTAWDGISKEIGGDSGRGIIGPAFENFARTPSAKVWKGVYTALHGTPKRRVAAWWWSGAAAACLLAAFLFYKTDPNFHIYSVSQQKTVTPTTKANAAQSKNMISPNREWNDSANPTPSQQKENTLENIGNAEINTPGNAESDVQNHVPPSDQTQPIAKSTVPTGDKNPVKAHSSEQVAAYSVNNGLTGLPNTLSGDLVQKDIPPTSIPPLNALIIHAAITPELDTIIVIPPDRGENAGKDRSTPFYDGKKPQKDHTYALLAGSQLAFSTDLSRNDMDHAYPGIASGEFTAMDAYREDTQYNTPVAYGVNFEIKIIRRLAAGTGIGYLQLSKTTENYFVSGREVVENARADYLSIPLYLKFSFVDRPKIDAYISLGHSWDILLSENISGEVFQNEISQKTYHKAGTQGNQANVYASTGIAWKFTRVIGVYAEGSLMRYYHSAEANFYNSQNLWPGLRVGAIVSF